MIIVIDNYDSFTWNLVDFLRRCKRAVAVFRNDEISAADLLALQPKGILISPGPGRPEESGISPAVLQAAAGKVPILGICLGHQLIGQHFGMAVLHGQEPVHGKTHAVFHDGDGLFRDVPSPFQAMRYHSLVLSQEDVPAELKVIAWTAAGEVMGIRHLTLPIAGLQFHPESILTEGGSVMVANWLRSLG